MAKWTVISVLLAGIAMWAVTGKAIIIEMPATKGHYGTINMVFGK